MQPRTVILHTYSKSFCMTGWRLGAAIGPKEIISHINRLNTNDEACTTHFIQWAGLQLTSAPAQDFLKHTLLPELKRRRDLVRCVTLLSLASPLSWNHIGTSFHHQLSNERMIRRFSRFPDRPSVEQGAWIPHISPKSNLLCLCECY